MEELFVRADMSLTNFAGAGIIPPQIGKMVCLQETGWSGGCNAYVSEARLLPLSKFPAEEKVCHGAKWGLQNKKSALN